MNIKVLGGGCANCHKTKDLAQETVNKLGLSATIESVTDMGEIMRYGVMRTPAVVIDEKVVHAGGVPTPQQMTDFLTAAQG